ncbi:hypothetical protein Bca101_040474 [Brassica carinata]
MMAEKDEELSLFLEMRRREKEQDSLLVNNPHEFEIPLGSKPGTSPVFNIPSGGAPARKTGPPDDFLSSEGDKNDYDMLGFRPLQVLLCFWSHIGEKTVERVINMRKLAPPNEKGSPHGNLSAKSSSPDSAGFEPASSMYSVRTGHTRGRPMNASDTPLATSSNASSENSVCNNNGICLEVSEREDDACSDREVAGRSPCKLTREVIE